MNQQPEIVTITERHTVYVTRLCAGTLTIYECEGLDAEGNEWMFNQSVIIEAGIAPIVSEPYRIVRLRGRWKS